MNSPSMEAQALPLKGSVRDKYQELALLVEEQRRRATRNVLRDFNLWPKQKEAIAGFEKTLAVFGGNRCLGGETLIYDPVKKEHRRVDSISEPFHVQAWDGKKVIETEAMAPFKKTMADLYRIEMESGEWFTASGDHLVLTPSGWIPVSDACHSGSVLCLPQSNLDNGLSVHPEDAGRWNHTTQDSQSDCPACRHSDDARLHSEEGGDPGTRPSLTDAQGRTSYGSHGPLDDQGSKQGCTHSYPRLSLPSIQDAHDLIGVLAVENGSQTGHTLWIPASDLLQDALQSHGVSSHQFPPNGEADLQATHSFSCRALAESCRITSYQKVRSVRFVRHDIRWDFEVPVYRNYIAGGVIHHNSGKTMLGAYATAVHATGLYPADWKGPKHITEPPVIWVAGISSQSTRDIIQQKLLGEIGNFGTGFIPAELIQGYRMNRNFPDAVEAVFVKHVPTGGTCTIGFKSMEQGYSKFQGTERHWIWLDEEPDREGYEIYMESKKRLMTVPNAQILVTFTPLKGMTELAKHMIEFKDDEAYRLTYITWDDAPHLAEKEKADLLRSAQPHEIEAISRGIPVVKEGLVYPFPLSKVLCDPVRDIPKDTKVVIGMDIGWEAPTAAVLIGWHDDWGHWKVLREYSQSRQSPGEIAAAVHEWGPSVYIAVDPSSNRSDQSGMKIMQEFKKLGMNVHNAKNARDMGIQKCFGMLGMDEIKICSDLEKTILEFRFYQYTTKKKRDHLMDAWRYGAMALDKARTTSYFALSKAFGTDHYGYRNAPIDLECGY